MITEIRYTIDPDIIDVYYEDQTKVTMHWPSGTWRDEEVQAWLDLGNTILPYDQYFGWTDEQIKSLKYGENAEHATSLADAAQLNPTEGDVVTSRQAKKNKARRDNAAKRKNNQITDQDDELLDYNDQVLDSQDQADDAVEALSDRQDIINWDPLLANWPTWVPPLP